MKKHFARSLFVVAAGLLAACTSTLNTHGQILPPSRLSQIQPGVTTRDEVMQLLGSPSSVGTLNDTRWYYMTSTTEDKPLSSNILKKSDVLIIDFTPSGTVAGVTKKSEEDEKKLTPAPAITKTSGQSMGILDQFIGNIGKLGKMGSN